MVDSTLNKIALKQPFTAFLIDVESQQANDKTLTIQHVVGNFAFSRGTPTNPF